jgi:hypothetical protein
MRMYCVCVCVYVCVCVSVCVCMFIHSSVVVSIHQFLHTPPDSVVCLLCTVLL